MQKLDGGYVRGYTEGLKKALEIIEYIPTDNRLHGRKTTVKSLSEALMAAIEGREALRENPEAFVRCNSKGGYEVYEPVKGRST